VNLFWGITLCDLCYFNEEVIKEIMKKRKEYVSDSQNNPFHIVEKVLVKPSSNESYFKLPVEKDSSNSSNSSNFFDFESPDIIVPLSPPQVEPVDSEDNRPVSSYVSNKKEESEEEVIHEEDSQGNEFDYATYFSPQSKFLDPENLFSD
jgi:hypothetical protein